MQTGVCYFPEHWPRERWEADVAAMADAGFSSIRMGEFSWAVLEPDRGEFAFDWLDEIIDIVADYGMDVVLCTPTATPPKWLVDDHPEIRQEEPDGTVREFGSRRHYCFNAEAYHRETDRLVSRLAERYADEPAVVGWQVDNEFGCHDTIRCYCSACGAAFREWLRDKYADIAAVNEAWGTRFWSQRYASFEEIDPPGHTPAEQHPSLLLDYARFASDSAVAYGERQAELLREANDEWFVTHNFMGHFDSLDAYDASDSLDFAAWDSYPTGFVQDRRPGEATPDELRAGDPDQVSLNHDLYRGAGGPFWVMEQQPGDVNWPPDCPQPGEGAMRLWAHHAFAHGADAVLYFRWRRCLTGQEQYHAGLRRQNGEPDRGYHDAVQVGADIEQFPEDTSVDAPVAFIHDYDSLWALAEQSHAGDFDYWSLFDAFYGAVRARGVQVDVVPPDRSLEEYAAVVAPSLYLVSDAMADRLTAYVEDGGQLLVGPRTGVKDRTNRLRATSQPGPLSALVGATVDQHESFPSQVETRVADDNRSYEFHTWAEWIDADDATPLVTYEMADITDGETAVVQNVAGSGSVVYCGVWPGEALADDLVVPLLGRADIEYADRLPAGVRVAVRGGLTWLCNFTSDRYHISPDATWLVGDRTLDAYDVAVTGENLISEVDVELI